MICVERRPQKKILSSRWEYVTPANIAKNGYYGLCSPIKVLS